MLVMWALKSPLAQREAHPERLAHVTMCSELCFRKCNVNTTSITDIRSCCFFSSFLLVFIFFALCIESRDLFVLFGAHLGYQVGCINTFLKNYHSRERSFWLDGYIWVLNILFVCFFSQSFTEESKDLVVN